VKMSGSESTARLSGAAALAICLVGAAIAWKPADIYYTPERMRHYGDGYISKIQNPSMSDAELKEKTQRAIFERRLFVGVVTAIWGATVCGLLGLAGGAVRKSAGGAAAALAGGAALGAAIGLVAGFSGQYVAEKYPITRFDTDLAQMTKTMCYHSLVYGLLGLATGIAYSLFARGKTRPALAVATATFGGAAAGMAFTPLASVAFPLVDTTSIVPLGALARLTWFCLPALFAGAALAFVDRRSGTARAAEPAAVSSPAPA
ncbi:MAG TPA: hypothetical protein VNC50_17440, partial [Planctomycetia bacterium]|nr:hypothetical protein [Planctomycetia bacterium]